MASSQALADFRERFEGRVEHQPAARYTAGMADARIGAFRLPMGPVPPFR